LAAGYRIAFRRIVKQKSRRQKWQRHPTAGRYTGTEVEVVGYQFYHLNNLFILWILENFTGGRATNALAQDALPDDKQDGQETAEKTANSSA